MPDITEQLQTWSRSLADATEPVDIERVTSGNGHARMVASRRWMAVAASVVLLVGGIVAVVQLRGGERVEPVATPTSTEPATTPTESATTPASATPAVTAAPTGPVALDHVVIVDGEPVGDTWVTGIARDAVGLTALWARIGLTGPPPTIDFARDVVVYFGLAEPSNCWFQPLAGVSYNPDTRRVFPVLGFSGLLNAEGTFDACTADANPYAIVVTIARDALPVGDFEIWVDDKDPPACCVTNVTRTNGDWLRTPAPVTTPPAPLPPTTVATGVACRGELDATTAFAFFVANMTTARTTGDFALVADCLSGVPGVFDGEPPFCWTACDGTTISFDYDPDRISPGGDAAGPAWFFNLPVSHTVDGVVVDVLESWTMRSTPDGWLVSGPTIEPPIVEREASLEVIDRYFTAIEQGNWDTVASLLNDGGLDLEQRLDLQELAPATYTRDDIARALAAWCAAGCDTTRPTAADLRFDGSYLFERNGRTISAVWFEGTYSISGLPFPSDP